MGDAGERKEEEHRRIDQDRRGRGSRREEGAGKGMRSGGRTERSSYDKADNLLLLHYFFHNPAHTQILGVNHVMCMH